MKNALGNVLVDVDEAEVREFQKGCVSINLMFYDLAQQGVMEYRDHWPKRTTPENIRWVGTDKTVRRKFRRILENLDNTAPMNEQAAYLLRAFSGLQLFPDANHRTGLIVAGFYLDANNWRFRATPVEMVRIVEEIRPVHGALSARRTVDRIGDRDASFYHIAAFMAEHTRRLTWAERALRRVRRASHLRRVFGDMPLDGIHASESPEDERLRKG